MVSRLLTSALFAGAATGLIAASLQLVFVQPVLLEAELYESGQLVHFGGQTMSARPDPGGINPVRDTLTAIFTMLIYTGYALILVAAMALAEARGARITARTGIVWGLAGFGAAQLAPGFSLAPELPGVAAADLTMRQIWWFATVGMAAVGIWLVAFGRSWAAWAAAIALLLAPHLVGAPEPGTFTGPVPTELGTLFAARALGVGAAAWIALGCFAGFFWQREGERGGVAQTA